MSAETKAALDDAIAAHLLDEDGAMLTGYVMKLEGRTVEGIESGESITRWECGEQTVIVTLGLASALKFDVDEWYRYGGGDDDDD